MLLRTLSAWMTCCLLAAVPLAAASADTSGAAQAMTAAARALLEATPAGQRPGLLLPFTLEARGDWHYTPRSRPGIAFKTTEDAQRQAAQPLLAAALSEPGLVKVQAIIALEIALREIESFGFSRDPENYAIALFGTPHATSPWGWRIEAECRVLPGLDLPTSYPRMTNRCCAWCSIKRVAWASPRSSAISPASAPPKGCALS